LEVGRHYAKEEFPMNVLVVDSDQATIETIAAALRNEGFDISFTISGSADLRMAQDGSLNLSELNVVLSEQDGLELTRHIRDEQVDRSPSFGAKMCEVEKGLTRRALQTNLVSRRFSLMEIMASHETTGKNNVVSERSETLQFTDLVMDEERHEVWRNEESIRLSATEFNLLRYFLKNPYRVLSKEEILAEVWHTKTGGSQNAVETYVHYLRRKLDTTGPPLIQTLRHVGYVLREEPPRFDRALP
jgi:two-component system, OmpR family, response regulator